MSREYQESGIGYLGKIPIDWNIYRIKNAFNCKKEIVGNKWSSTQLLSLTTSGIKEKDIENPNGKLPESFDGYQLVNKNDLVMCLFDLDCSAVFSGISKYEGMISPAYKVLKCTNLMDPNYAGYYFNYISFDRKYMHYSKNIRYTLSYDEFSSLPMIFPPLNEQRKIAEYLDNKCKKIDEIIEDNRREIDIILEYKQSRINECVTQGIRENDFSKSSNSLFYKKVPNNWDVIKLKHISSFSKGNGITKEEVNDDGDIQCVRYGEIYSKYDNIFSSTFSRTKLSLINNPKYITKGDILVAGTGELIEEIGKNILYDGDMPCLAGGDIIIVKHNQDASFLNYSLGSITSQNQKSFGKMKLKVVHIYPSELGNIEIALPPLNEQKEISAYLDKLCSNLNKVIEYRKQIIEKLEEYKKSLIYECVTGKKEVN